MFEIDIQVARSGLLSETAKFDHNSLSLRAHDFRVQDELEDNKATCERV